ncbi:MAG: transcription antitermination factor NusB [Bacilli bacterium]
MRKNEESSEDILAKIEARRYAIGYVYQMIVTNDSAENVLLQHQEGMHKFTSIVCNGVNDNLAVITKEIESKLNNKWPLNRLNFIDRAILFVATYELMFTDLSRIIIISAAVDLAKTYCDDDRYKFINGVLDNVGK